MTLDAGLLRGHRKPARAELARRQPGASGGAPDAETATLLAMLAAGMTDASIARSPSWSMRTTQRRMRQLMNDLGATSRFQAGVAPVRKAGCDASTAKAKTAAAQTGDAVADTGLGPPGKRSTPLFRTDRGSTQPGMRFLFVNELVGHGTSCGRLEFCYCLDRRGSWVNTATDLTTFESHPGQDTFPGSAAPVPSPRSRVAVCHLRRGICTLRPRRGGERLKSGDCSYGEIISISCSFYLCSGGTGPLGALGISRLLRSRSRARALPLFTGLDAAVHRAPPRLPGASPTHRLALERVHPCSATVAVRPLRPIAPVHPDTAADLQALHDRLVTAGLSVWLVRHQWGVAVAIASSGPVAAVADAVLMRVLADLRGDGFDWAEAAPGIVRVGTKQRHQQVGGARALEYRRAQRDLRARQRAYP